MPCIHLENVSLLMTSSTGSVPQFTSIKTMVTTFLKQRSTLPARCEKRGHKKNTGHELQSINHCFRIIILPSSNITVAPQVWGDVRSHIRSCLKRAIHTRMHLPDGGPSRSSEIWATATEQKRCRIQPAFYGHTSQEKANLALGFVTSAPQGKHQKLTVYLVGQRHLDKRSLAESLKGQK